MTIMGEWADDVDVAVAVTVEALSAVADGGEGAGGDGEEEWAEAAHGLEWSCRKTAVHIADDFAGYATQLTGRSKQGYAPYEIVARPGTDARGLVRIVGSTGGLLSAVVRTTPADVRAWHPYGDAGPDGFAAMGILETLLHTHDIVTARTGTGWRPPAGRCERIVDRVLDRLFPHVPRSAGDDPWAVLLHATGRAEAEDGTPRPSVWRWYADPVRSERLLLCEISPPVGAELHGGGSGGFRWAEGGPEEGTRFAGGMVVKAREDGSYRPGWGSYAIVRAEDGRAVGGVGFHAAPDQEGAVEIGYDVVASARGQGYAAEALAALVHWTLTDPAVRVVRATVDHPNAASHAVVARAGFQRVSADAENVRYELRRAE